MLFNYFDALTGDDIHVAGVGNFHSPKLKELMPCSGIGTDMYNLYIDFLTWDKETVLKTGKKLNIRGVERLETEEKLTAYDIITLLPQMRELCLEALSFFISGDLSWNEDRRSFVASIADDDGQHVTGEIRRDNFETVRSIILQLNFIQLEKKDNKGFEKSSDKAKELWNKAQEYLKKQHEREKENAKTEYSLGNVVSKLCSIHPTYNFINVWELTVFQLYDAFFQTGYMRSVELGDAIYCNHGGKDYKFEAWLKPILTNIM